MIKNIKKTLDLFTSGHDTIAYNNGMTDNSAASVDDIASRSDDMRYANEEGYKKLQDAREAVKELVRITEKFHW